LKKILGPAKSKFLIENKRQKGSSNDTENKLMVDRSRNEEKCEKKTN
jgi:hypothetical protein